MEAHTSTQPASGVAQAHRILASKPTATAPMLGTRRRGCGQRAATHVPAVSETDNEG